VYATLGEGLAEKMTTETSKNGEKVCEDVLSRRPQNIAKGKLGISSSENFLFTFQ
jgi:hypothetical protein